MGTQIAVLPERQELGLSRQRFGHLIGLSYETIKLWERGVRKPTIIQQMRINALVDLIKKNPNILAASDDAILKRMDKLVTEPTLGEKEDKARESAAIREKIKDEKIIQQWLVLLKQEGYGEEDARIYAENHMAYCNGQPIPYPDWIDPIEEKRKQKEEEENRKLQEDMLRSILKRVKYFGQRDEAMEDFIRLGKRFHDQAKVQEIYEKEFNARQRASQFFDAPPAD